MPNRRLRGNRTWSVRCHLQETFSAERNSCGTADTILHRSPKMTDTLKLEETADGGCPPATCSACGGSGLGKQMYTEIDNTWRRDRCYTCKGTGTSAPRSPAVEWQAANLHPCDGSGSTTKAWQLRVNGRVILNAVAMSNLHEAVSPEDRRMIGVALAQYLQNA